MSALIEDYALIGDCESAALVSRHGSIDWLCLPNFASPACFAALVGTEENGHWSIAPKDKARCTRRYLDHTLVVETTFETDGGSAVLLDFMPLRNGSPHLVRIVRGVRGALAMSVELVLRFDYGRSVPWVTRLQDGRLRAIAGPDMAVLNTTAQLRGENLKTLSEFAIGAGESVTFVLTYGPSYDGLPEPIDPEKALQETISFWEEWAGRAKLHGELRRCRRTIVDHAQGAHLPSHGRNRRCSDHLLAGTARRRAKLGLSLLLASRCHVYPARTYECGLLRGSPSLARLAAAGGGGKPRSSADHVWHSGRA